jgi:hypothetical protein
MIPIQNPDELMTKEIRLSKYDTSLQNDQEE